MGAPVLRDVVLIHEPGVGTDRPADSEGERLQEPGVPAAQGARREGRQSAPARAGGRADHPHARAGRLHRRKVHWALQAGHVSILSRQLVRRVTTALARTIVARRWRDTFFLASVFPLAAAVAS